jgi:DNA-binding response OmpR family regulator
LHYATGPDALDGLLSLSVGARVPIILLDVDLPGLDGFSLHERLRVERPGAFATVFLTARGGEAEQLRAYRAGAIDYVPKPVNLRILMAKIPSWLERCRRGGSGGITAA